MLVLNRKNLLRRLLAAASFVWAPLPSSHAFSNLNPQTQIAHNPTETTATTRTTTTTTASPKEEYTKTTIVGYRGFSMPIEPFGVQVPVSCWFPIEKKSEPGTSKQARKSMTTMAPPASYKYRISVRRIGQLLAQWNFIPGLVARDFSLPPARSDGVVDGRGFSVPSSGPVILLAHGYLGSRFDMSHLAEDLAAEGFTCVSTEYPESLAASYDRMDALDRDVINNNLLKFLEADMNVKSNKFGIIGHSLGCLTVLRTGDQNWARVMVAGSPRRRDGSVIPGNILFVSSMNDGVISLARFGGAEGYPKDITMLTEEHILTAATQGQRIPPRAGILFDRPGAPNHISFLSESVNDSMIDFLSPLLPLARAFDIPLLDFDRYQISRDSRRTAEIVHPIIIRYMKQQMMME